MSSIKAISGKPPTRSNADLRTKIAWSPVAMPVSRERRFIMLATTRSIAGPGMGLARRVTSKRPHAAVEFASARSISSCAVLGSCVSTCRNRRISPCAAAAPAFCWRARPAVDVMMIAPCALAKVTVSSLLPPSTTMISAPRSRNDASAPSAAAMQADSFRVGMMIEITEWKVWRVSWGGLARSKRSNSSCD